MSDPRRPPALARALIRILLPDSVRPPFEGDLEERFHRTAASSLRKARWDYWRDVVSPTVLRLRKEARSMPLPPGSPPVPGPRIFSLNGIASDFKFALRTLRKSPGFAAVAVLSLALGIGPNTAIFSLVDSLVLREWGVEDSDGLIDVYTVAAGGGLFYSYYSAYEMVEEGAADVFEEVAQHSIFSGGLAPPNGDPELVLGEMVSSNYFDVMGVRAALGRTFLPEEGATLGTHPVVVLGNDYWRTRHGSDPDIVGREVRLNGRPYTVVGVAPREFRGRVAPGLGTDFWVPFEMYPHLAPSKLGNGDLLITGRLREGVTNDQAIAAIRVIGTREQARRTREVEDYRGEFGLAGFTVADVTLHPAIDGTVSLIAVLLFVAVGLVLLVACVNLAGYLLARATDRRREMAVRTAMGAGRPAIVRQLLVESTVIAALGAALGLALGQIAVRALVSVESPLPVPLGIEVGWNGRLLLFTTGVAAAAAVFFGLAPALEATRAPAAATLRDEAGSSGGRRAARARGLLVMGQMALSTVLIFSAALFLRSLQSATNLDLGFRTRDAAIVRFDSQANEYTIPEREAFVDELSRRLGELAVVNRFALVTRLPLELGVSNLAFDVPGVDPPPDRSRHLLEQAAVGPDYFQTMGIDLVQGREFRSSDRVDAPPVAVLSRAAAERFWPNESAVGKVLIRNPDGSDAITVVGVADDVKIWNLAEAPLPYVYVPYHQRLLYTEFGVVAVGPGEPTALARLIRDEARAIDPDIFVTEVGTMREHLGYAFFLPRLAAVMLSLVGGIALALACIGLYGMVSYGVSRRVREVGIRLALGADRAAVVTMMVRSGLVLVIIGGAVGIAISLGLGPVVEGFLLGVDGLDPTALAAAVVVLGGIAVTAAYIPARRASRIDPMGALRSE